MANETSAEPVFVVSRSVRFSLIATSANDVRGSAAGMPILGTTGLLPPQINKPVAPKLLRTVTATSTVVACGGIVEMFVSGAIEFRPAVTSVVRSAGTARIGTIPAMPAA